MATEHISGPPNGLYGTHHVAHPSVPQAAVPQSVSPVPKQHPSQNPNVSKEEVAWYFVERYYNTLSKKPAHLHLFFSKQSQFVTGVEEEKVQVYHGQRAINDKIQELDYQDCKVRVTNVDSQTSGENIVVQVIGEISNKAQPHRKFVQTFVLAPQTNGYFVLNDIFRTMADEEDPEVVQPAAAVEADASASAKDEAPAAAHDDVDVDKVDEELEQYATEVKVNGDVAAAEATEAVDDAPAVAVTVEEPAVEAKVDEAEAEKPKEPAPTPVQDTKAAKPRTPVPAPRPSAPKTWAQLARDSSSTTLAAAAAAPAAATLPPPPTPVKSASQSPAPGLAPSPGAAPPAAPPAASPARQPSPADSLQEGSSGGWITAGDHSRNKSRTQTGPTVQEDGRVRAYVKNVFATVDGNELRAELSKYGELAYFDISRQKNSAFVEFATLGGFNAAVANNPHNVGNEKIFVEERRPPAYATRGGARGGRGGFDSRPQRGGFVPKGDGAPRGGFAGRARGGANSMSTRPRAQAA